jgi:hypothetical protein
MPIKFKVTLDPEALETLQKLQEDPKFIEMCNKRIKPMINGWVLKWSIRDYFNKFLEKAKWN